MTRAARVRTKEAQFMPGPGRNYSKRVGKSALPASVPQIQLWIIRSDGTRVAVPPQTATPRGRAATVAISPMVRETIRDGRIPRG